MYQGHMNDGSSVQRHSAGPLYPCVIYAQQIGPGVLWYGVISPEIPEGVLCGCHDAAVQYAKNCNIAAGRVH